jgi:prespore-specific regulator
MRGRSWTTEEDRILTEEVLAAVRQGQSQLEAFERVGQRIGRTAGACGFRWNAVLRKREMQAFQDAKRERVTKQLKRYRSSGDSLKKAIRSLREMDQWYREDQQKLDQLERLRRQRESRLKELKERHARLKEEWDSIRDFQDEIKDRYARLVKLLEQVRNVRMDWEENEKREEAISSASGKADVDTERRVES